jgi:hypothetical protein
MLNHFNNSKRIKYRFVSNANDIILKNCLILHTSFCLKTSGIIDIMG